MDAGQVVHPLEIFDNIVIIGGLADLRDPQVTDDFIFSQVRPCLATVFIFCNGLAFLSKRFWISVSIVERS